MDGCTVGSAGCVVHLHVHGRDTLWVAATSRLLSMADVVCLVFRSCGVHEQC